MLLSLPSFLLPSYAWILLLAFGCLMTSFAKSSSAEKNVVPHSEGHGASGSILDHTDRQLLVIFAILLAAFSLQQISAYLVALIAVLANISVIQRVANARKVWLGSMR
jgi:phosphatidylglycerophosphate synthase